MGSKLVVVFDMDEVYGKELAAQLLPLFQGKATKEALAFNTLNVNRAGMNAILAEPIYQAIDKKGSATIDMG